MSVTYFHKGQVEGYLFLTFFIIMLFRCLLVVTLSVFTMKVQYNYLG